MANLKGKSFDQQLKNAKIRLESRGQSRNNRVDHQTHSNALADKRDKYLSDFSNYIKSSQEETGKLNQYMTNNIVKDFLKKRTDGLSSKTTADYTRGFSALIDGLKANKVNISVEKDIFNKFVSRVKSEAKVDPIIKQNRNIKNLDTVIEKLSQKNQGFETVAEVQSELGIRVSEALELVSNPSYYIAKDYSVNNLTGKGGFVYSQKQISSELVKSIGAGIDIRYSSYQAALKEQNITSHDLRYTYVKNRMSTLLNTKSYKEALKIVSEEINHHRSSITEYYLSQTSF